jgi:hypothetical protein
MQSLRVFPLGPTALYFKWESSESLNVELKGYAELEKFIDNPTKTGVKLEKLQPDKTYRIKVAALTENGVGRR